MARGAAPGERRGGRPAGLPNKKTIERLERAQEALTAAKKLKKDQAVQVLEKFMFAFGDMAVRYQCARPGEPKLPHEDPDKFEKWGRLAIEAAAALAKYQSPTFKAINVTTAPMMPIGPDPKLIEGSVVPGSAKIIDINDQQELARVYRQMIVSVRSR